LLGLLPDSLQSLNLANCYLIRDTSLHLLPRGLRELNLNSCSITGCQQADETLPITGVVETQTSIEAKLAMAVEQCKRSNVNGIWDLPHGLTSLDLSSCKLTEMGFYVLSNMLPALQRLVLNQVSAQGDYISLPTSLTVLGNLSRSLFLFFSLALSSLYLRFALLQLPLLSCFVTRLGSKPQRHNSYSL